MARGRDWSGINPRVEARLGYRRMDRHRHIASAVRVDGRRDGRRAA